MVPREICRGWPSWKFLLYIGVMYLSEVRAHLFNLKHVTPLSKLSEGFSQLAMERAQVLGRGARVQTLAPSLP